ncbi:extracellular solute-binding protein [Secundilactobacillus folii]|uniref:Extracellular solute-binding protein n=1 Tax=Secundilactobacillus folii TaxID=2678357 RepID=A0A7X2XVW5_9LACO|nr:extracellular solute-binding protein [Secundilactobacillus folii]MTV82586.1 extracellular solute-binding protein [Secundilactobacillus folii]
MKIRYQRWWLGLALLLIVLPLGACARTQAASRTQIVFWHEMTGPGQDQLKQFAKEFNASQDKYQVVPQYEGSYNEAVQKILHTHGTSASPAVFQSMDVSTSQLYHAHVATPMQKFIDKDNFDVNQISPVARAFYSQGGKQISMPFNTSQPVLYYNASVLKRLGIKAPPVDPSYSDITRVAKAISTKSHGKIKGLTVEEYGWLFEQFMANSDEHLANHEDGRTGIPTKVHLNTPGTQEAMKWVKSNIKSGDFIDYGAGGQAESNEIAAFLAGKLGIFIQSSAYISQLLAGTKDQLGITYYPHRNGKPANGVAIGGASLWIGNDKPKDVQQGAWKFVQFVMSAKAQAQWQAATGYLALNKDSQAQPILQKLYQKYPAAQVPSQQLARIKANTANSGVFMEGVIQERNLTQTAMAQIYNGTPIDKALAIAEKGLNDAVANTNRANHYK